MMHDPLAVIGEAMAGRLEPPGELVPSLWAIDNLILPDGPRAGERWDVGLTPYVSEIIDCLAPNTGNTLAVVRKSAQTGITVAGLALIGSYIDKAPCNMGIVLPTIDLMYEFNASKLDVMIDKTTVLKEKIRESKSRSSQGSTMSRKKFSGGSLVILNANSGADLRSKTLKIGVADEIDQWQWDLDGQGDPFKLFQGRFIAFHASGDYRVLAMSTPRIKDQSRIDAMYLVGDQRQWHVKCPHCGTEITLEFDNLEFETVPPYQARYVTQCCGCTIEHGAKAPLVRGGRFIATNPQGRYPSFHIDTMISQLTTWDHLAEESIDANQGDETKKRSFVNVWLGKSYEPQGAVNDIKRLMSLREDYPENVVPAEALILVAGADVQHNGIWVEVVAFAPNRQSWCITARFLEGDTTDPSEGAFIALADLYEETFPASQGRPRKIEAMAVDAGDGGRSNQVYLFCKLRPLAYSIKGAAGWQLPAVGAPSYVTVSWKGKIIKNGARLWPIGTYSLKSEFVTNLAKLGIKETDKTKNPIGYCHYGMFVSETYFIHVTAEHLEDKNVGGRMSKVWVRTNANHLLDARVYAMAMAEKLGLTTNKADRWKQIAKDYGLEEQIAIDIEKRVIQVPASEPPRRRRRQISRGV